MTILDLTDEQGDTEGRFEITDRGVQIDGEQMNIEQGNRELISLAEDYGFPETGDGIDLDDEELFNWLDEQATEADKFINRHLPEGVWAGWESGSYQIMEVNSDEA
jgi:hypothetical protein